MKILIEDAIVVIFKIFINFSKQSSGSSISFNIFDFSDYKYLLLNYSEDLSTLEFCNSLGKLFCLTLNIL